MKQTKKNKISELQSTGGRFTSLTVNKGGRKVSYCAQIRKVLGAPWTGKDPAQVQDPDAG